MPIESSSRRPFVIAILRGSAIGAHLPDSALSDDDELHARRARVFERLRLRREAGELRAFAQQGDGLRRAFQTVRLFHQPVPDIATNSYVQLFYDYSPIPVELKDGGTKEKHTFPRFRKRVAGHRLMIGEGTYDQPNLQMKFDAIRITKGVLDPSQFMRRVKSGLVILLR